MAVKCLNHRQKKEIVGAYMGKTLNQKELAQFYDTSERTINRVLVEAGLLTPVARIKGEAYKVMQLLQKHNIDYAGLEQLIASAKMLQLQVRTQATPTKKSPKGHNGKQTMLALPTPIQQDPYLVGAV